MLDDDDDEDWPDLMTRMTKMLHSILSVLQGFSCPSGDDDWIAGVEEDVEDPLAQDEVDGGAGDGLLIAFVHS